MVGLSGLDHLVLTVRDIEASVRFYVDVLGMVAERFPAADGSLRTALKFGPQKINLHQAGAEFEPKAACATAGSADLCFLTGNRLVDWQAHLVEQGVEVIDGPVARTGANGAIMSLYIRDPDGNLIEVSSCG
ncbi:MAG: VOC family protein [Alphaproteobacteria bacterium]|nr:VOC family protein [Alphaproteobacteria bacterium]